MYQISYNCTREKSPFCCIITLKAFKSHTVYCMISLILHSRKGNNKQINECQGSECEGTRWPQCVTRDSPEVRELFCSWLLRGLPGCRCQYLRVYKGRDNLNKELYFYSLLKNFKDVFNVYVCMFACVHMCAPCVCLMPLEARRELWVPQNWVTGSCEPTCGYWEPNPSTLEEQQVFVTLFPASKGYGFFEFKPGWQLHMRYIFTMKAFMARQKMGLRTAQTTGWDPFPKREQLESFTLPTLDPLNSKYLSVPVSQVAGLQAKPTRPG